MRSSDRLLAVPEKAARYVEISTGAIIRDALDRSWKTRRPSLVTGPSGVGKSAAIAELLADGEAVGCTVTAAHHSVPGIYRMLLHVYGADEPGRGTLHELERRVYGEIGPQRDWGGGLDPLILDEYQGIEPLALRELLKVQETLRFALVLVGNGETIAERRRPEQLRAMQQIQNRFEYQAQIEDLVDADFDMLADEWLVEPDEHTRKSLAAYGRSFSLHQLTMLLTAARELAAIGPTRLEHLRAIVALNNRSRLPIFNGKVTPLRRKPAP